MQTFKNKQQEFFKWDHLRDKTHKRLEEDWCGIWQREIMPMIDERKFADLYCSDDGRPSKATAEMVSLLILKEMEDLTDAQTVRRVMYGLDWQYALDMSPEEAYVAERTMQYFRDSVMRSEKHRIIFQDITDSIIVKLDTSASRQRKDSTHIMSNMAHLTRLGLFVKTIEMFMKQLQNKMPRKYNSLDKELRERYVERGTGRFGDARGSEARRRIDTCAVDAWHLLERFKNSKNARALDGYRLLNRLFKEQCAVEEGERIALRKDVSCDSLQSPYDEDAGYSGHKGKGYQAQLTETNDAENAAQIITHIAVESAAESDAESPVRDIEELEERGHKPDELTADTAYCGGDNDVALREMGVTLIGPAAGKEPGDKAVNIGAFDTSFDLKQVNACPGGNAPASSRFDPDWDTVTAVFDKDACRGCELRNICGVKRNKQGYALKYERCRMATSKRRMMEKTEAFKKAYARRSGIEATNSELKRAHGLGRLRVRGRPAVEFAVFMKVTACNIKRYMKARGEQARRAAGDENAAACAPLTPENALIGALRALRAVLFRGSSFSARVAA